MITAPKVGQDIFDRLSSKLFDDSSESFMPPENPEALIEMVRGIARPTEKIVHTQEFEELVFYWFNYGDMTPGRLAYAAADLLEAHNVLHIFATHGIVDIEDLRNFLNDFKLQNAEQLQFWLGVKEANEHLAKTSANQRSNGLDLYIHGLPNSLQLIPNPRLQHQKSYQKSWQAQVDNAAEIFKFYTQLLNDTGHASTNFQSWATRYFFRNTSIKCVHILDRSIFPKPWKLLNTLLAECFIARDTHAVRSTVEQLCAKNCK